ncbi:MAG: radical SAM protein [Candidatus Omnitrophica bacterium]|nr:radical SAM protein [Candidatus Omnitrophota bacterium]
MKKDRPVMSLDNYKHIVEQAKDLDVLAWNITGGEPLMIDWLENLIITLKPRKHYIAIQTNCSLLTKKKALQFARLGVNCITTSLDSLSAETHDRFRGFSGSHQKVFEGIRNARQAGMQTLVGITVTHQNLRSQDLVNVIKAANKEGAICLFNLAVPCGEWRDNKDIILRGDDRDYLMGIMKRFPMTSTDHEIGLKNIGCPAGVEKIYITPYGDVIPCPFIPVTFGNILEEPLIDIVKNMQSLPEFSQYQHICIAAEDENFQKNVLDKVYTEYKSYPVYYKEIFRNKLKK